MKIKEMELEGRMHLVVPMVMIREGTWAGSHGPVYYPSNVLKSSVSLWNGKPIVVYHPDMYGAAAADNPLIFNKAKVGVVFNTRFAAGKLKADAWLDKERLRKIDNRILTSLQSRTPVEVSTGVMMFADEKQTRNDGAMVADALLPDHLAILPDRPGACSVNDGAGLLMNAAIIEPLTMPSVFA